VFRDDEMFIFFANNLFSSGLSSAVVENFRKGNACAEWVLAQLFGVRLEGGNRILFCSIAGGIGHKSGQHRKPSLTVE
jgi:hypothetical protein